MQPNMLGYLPLSESQNRPLSRPFRLAPGGHRVQEDWPVIRTPRELSRIPLLDGH